MRMKQEEINAYVQLRQARPRMTRQEHKTLKGLIIAGRPEAAMRGLKTILDRK